MNVNLSHEDRVRKAHVAVFSSPEWCWLTQVVLLGKWSVEQSDDRPRTDGYNVVYTTGRIDQLWAAHGAAGITYVVVHENMHKACRHLIVWAHLWRQDARRANVAADTFINIQIHKSGLPVPVDSVQPDMQYDGMSVAQIFELLPTDGEQDGDDEHDWANAEKGDGDGDTVQTKLEQAVQQGLFMQSQKHPDKARGIKALLAPVVDWRRELLPWMQRRTKGHDESNWRRRSRRGIALNIPLPSRRSTRTGRIVVAVDMSGSISIDEATAYLSELSALCAVAQPAQVDVWYWGSTVVRKEAYTPSQYPQIATLTQPCAGGGTLLGSVLQELRDTGNADVTGVVVMTDGYVGDGWFDGQWPCDVFVMCTTHAPVPFAHVRLSL